MRIAADFFINEKLLNFYFLLFTFYLKNFYFLLHRQKILSNSSFQAGHILQLKLIEKFFPPDDSFFLKVTHLISEGSFGFQFI